MQNSLPPLSLYNFTFHLEALEEMNLPEYKGSMFRGAFGWAFRKAVCVTHFSECGGCLLKNNCSYFRIFETELPEREIPGFRGIKKLPHPFVIHPPVERNTFYPKGAVLKVGISIFGRFAEMLPFFVYTFQKMGETGISYKRSRFRLLSVYHALPGGAEQLIFSAENGRLTTSYTPHTVSDIIGRAGNVPAKEVTIEFLTPWRLQEENKLVMSPSRIKPGSIPVSVYRRYRAISAFYCDGNPGHNYEIPPGLTIKDNSLHFYDWERYSARQETKISLGGFIGKIKLAGSVKDIIPLLKIGEYLNIGKNSIFGLGRYKILEISS